MNSPVHEKSALARPTAYCMTGSHVPLPEAVDEALYASSLGSLVRISRYMDNGVAKYNILPICGMEGKCIAELAHLLKRIWFDDALLGPQPD